MDQLLKEPLMALRIIIAAMLGGLAALTIVALFVDVAPAEGSPEGLDSTLLLVLGLFAVAELPAYLVVRHKTINDLRRSWANRSTEHQQTRALAGAFATITIIGAAMVEGLGLFGAVIYMLTGNGCGLIAPGLAAVVLLVLFPTYGKVQELKSIVTGYFT